VAKFRETWLVVAPIAWNIHSNLVEKLVKGHCSSVGAGGLAIWTVFDLDDDRNAPISEPSVFEWLHFRGVTNAEGLATSFLLDFWASLA
jgi:hypothetical protein